MTEPKLEPIPARGYIPAAATAANISMGFTAAIVAADGAYDVAVYLLVVAVLLDMLDGRLARMLNATSTFGKQLDSFCDVLSFGAAPALLVYLALLRQLGFIGLAAALTYLLATVYRLARFNILSDPHAKSRRTLGVPAPVGAGYLMVLTLMRDQIDPLWGAVVVVAGAAAMISRWRLPELKGAGAVSAALVVGIFNYLAVVAWPNWYTVAWWNVWNLAILVAARFEDRRPAVEPARES